MTEQHTQGRLKIRKCPYCFNHGEDCGNSIIDGPGVLSEGRMPHAMAAELVRRWNAFEEPGGAVAGAIEALRAITGLKTKAVMAKGWPQYEISGRLDATTWHALHRTLAALVEPGAEVRE